MIHNGTSNIRVLKGTSLSSAGQGMKWNPEGNDLDFQWSSDNVSAMLYIDGGNDNIGIGAAPTATEGELQVTDGRIASYAPLFSSLLAAGDNAFTNTHLQGYLHVATTSSAITIDLPLTPVKGQWCSFVSTSGNVTVDPNSDGGTTNTLNGGTGTASRDTNNEIYTLVCISSSPGVWILSNPA